MGEALDILDSCTDDELQFLVDIILQKGDLTESLTGEDEYGNIRTEFNIHMNGSAISEFALDVVPDTVNKIFAKTGRTGDDIG